MSKTLKEMVEFLSTDHFIKITNTADFPQLSSETREILKTLGLPSSDGSYPDLISTGKLKLFKPRIIEIGFLKIPELGVKFCIDLENNEQIIVYDTNNTITKVNSSLKKFIECKYTMARYYREIEFPEKHGPYYENENYKKYAKILRKMLNEVEPGIENYPGWEMELFEKELGVI